MTNGNPYVLDFGLKPKPKLGRRKMPDDFLLRHFDPLTATKINFVPIMLRSLVLSSATDLADLLADLRAPGLKKHTRLLRDIVRQCESADLRERGSREVAERKAYTDRYAKTVRTDCWLFLRNLEEQAVNAIPQKDRRICAFVTFMALIAEFARTYERQMNEMISDTCGETVTKPPEKYSTLIYAVCVDIADTYGYQLTISRDARLWVQILANKALALCETCYEEEKSQQKNQPT